MKLIQPIEVAWDRMTGQLFRPFDISRWFLIGFTAWLASFLTGGNSFNYSGSSKDKDFEGLSAKVAGWGPEIWIPLIGGILLVVVVLMLVFFWLGCRGQFMLLDNVVQGRALVRAPWREFRERANSLFKFFVLVQFSWLFAILLLAGLLAAYYWLVPNPGHSWVYFTPYGIGFLLCFLSLVFMAAALFFVRDFGVLWMYRNGGTAWEAARKVQELAAAQPADFFLYLLVRFVMAIVILITGAIAGCLTCCVGFLPYLNSVLTLPLSVFRVWYAVECFAQLGPDCDLRPQPPVTPPELPAFGLPE